MKFCNLIFLANREAMYGVESGACVETSRWHTLGGMKKVVLLAASGLAAATSFGACAGQESGQDQIVRVADDGQFAEEESYDEAGKLSVSYTVQEFIDDHRMLDAGGQSDTCEMLYSVESDGLGFFYNAMRDAGYRGDQIVNMFEALTAVC
ncbi:MAG: hypothetical protein GKR86_15640 [Ilumatobacter sp.]|nr:hypothetical protein [Ilumatobacter sp.]